ncbi:MAG: NAD-dependent epimerase/dehydratase family protein [Eubacteriales bacterium]|nr:NAD-dependent epimerase/dehydratase family protein [Eubacteriales bacterium]
MKVNQENENKTKSLYLVTGAAGFLGGTVCRQLLMKRKRVRALVLPGDKAARFIPEQVERCEGDLTDQDALRRFFSAEEGTDIYVIHCASIVTVNPDYSQKVMDVNVGGTKNIISCCRETPGFRKLVYVSSTGAIPERPKGEKIAEVDHFAPETMPELVRGCYSQSKALATQAVLDAVREYGLNACVVHPSGIMGPEDYAVGETTGTMIKIINGEMPMGIDGTFNLCDVRDLAAGCIAALEKGRRGECYILGNKAVRFKDFARIVSEEAGCKAPGLFLPCRVAGWMASITEKRAKRKGKRPLLTTFSIYNLARNNDFDSSKAERELGYHTRSYRETMRDEIAWLKMSGKIGALQV